VQKKVSLFPTSSPGSSSYMAREKWEDPGKGSLRTDCPFPPVKAKAAKISTIHGHFSACAKANLPWRWPIHCLRTNFSWPSWDEIFQSGNVFFC
jgi:hypothetical protein